LRPRPAGALTSGGEGKEAAQALSAAAKENVMGGLSIWHILIIAAVAVVLFGGRGKISDLMGDVAKGIKSFRKGLSEPDDDHPRPLADQRRDDTMVNKDQTVGR
jgi:sec-independent protein translocase protein TatA